MTRNNNKDSISHLKVKISQAISMVTTSIKAKKVPMIHGSPAIGKSGIVQQIADEYNLKLIDLRLSQCDPTDLLGFPHIQNGRAGYVPMDTFPIEGDELPEGKSGWLLFLDEFNSASVAVQAAAYKIVLDRMVGKYNLHPNVAVVCAGNLETDGAIVEPMSTALQSRIVHLELEVDPEEWVKWAVSAGVDHRITSFIGFKPGMVYTFKPDHTDRTYAAPRTWKFADDFLKIMDIKSNDALALLSGCISEGVAREFMSFCEIYDSLPSIKDIIASPSQVKVPDEPSVLFAVSGSIAHHLKTGTGSNTQELTEYLQRIPLEFQIVCIRTAFQRDKGLMIDPNVQKWITKHAKDLF